MTFSEKVREYLEDARKYDLGADYIVLLPGVIGGNALTVEVTEVLEDGIVAGGLLIPYVFGVAPLNDATAQEIRAQRSGIALPGSQGFADKIKKI